MLKPQPLARCGWGDSWFVDMPEWSLKDGQKIIEGPGKERNSVSSGNKD